MPVRWENGMAQKRSYRPGSRAARFLKLRDAIMAHSKFTKTGTLGKLELACGPYQISFWPPESMPGRSYNLQIWPGGKEDSGHIMHTNKVANVDWDQWDNVEILTFRSGEWEEELLALLQGSTNLILFPRP